MAFKSKHAYHPTINLSLFQAVFDLSELICRMSEGLEPDIIINTIKIICCNEYKNYGFTIVGVAAEQENTDQLIRTLEREKFPWVNLIELNNKNGIWIKYGIPNSGGGTFLVDKNGKIIAIKPTAKEVKEILKQKIK